jgi:hypothetical protein
MQRMVRKKWVTKRLLTDKIHLSKGGAKQVIQYMIVRTACADAPGYIYRHKIPILISIWQTIYGVVSVYENRVIAEETINDPQNDTASLSPFIHLWERWSQITRLSLSPFLQYISDTRNPPSFFSQANRKLHSNKQHVEYSNEIYVFDYRRREKVTLH